MAPPKKSPRIFKNDRWHECHTKFLNSITNSITKYDYAKTLRRLFAFVEQKYGKHRAPEKLIQADIEDFLNQPVSSRSNRVGEPLSPYTRNAYMMSIRSFYGFASRYLVEYRGKMVPIFRGRSPVEEVKLAKTGEVDRDFEEEELRAFFAAIDTSTILGKRDFCLFWCLFVTGKRRAEITNLLRGDIEPALFEENGRKRTGWRYYFLGKWRVAKEAAEMPEECIAAIRDFHRAAGMDFDTMPPEHPLFFGVAGPARRSQPLSLGNVDKRFRAYAKAAGIADTVVLHSLRHENAWSRYNLNGFDILEVKNALGHRDVKTTLHYIEKRKRRQQGDPVASMIAAKFAMGR